MIKVFHGDVMDGLSRLESGSVNCVVTSPPYWGLRDYGVEGQIGCERTYTDYVAKMVEVFEEVRRVLRPDGVLWLNLGDTYATGAGKVGACPGGGAQGERWKAGYRGTHDDSPKHAQVPDSINPNACVPTWQPNRMPQPGLKPKDLAGIPWRVALALQEAGWWLRCDVVWHKPNCMPESVGDRPTKAHEYVFMLTKSERYWYDAEAVKEHAITGDVRRPYGSRGSYQAHKHPMGAERKPNTDCSRRNLRSVWPIVTQPHVGAHFATFPEALAERCILAGCPVGGVVLDPFAGSGTTLAVADRLGRDAVGIELNGEYVKLIEKRCETVYGSAVVEQLATRGTKSTNEAVV